MTSFFTSIVNQILIFFLLHFNKILSLLRDTAEMRKVKYTYIIYVHAISVCVCRRGIHTRGCVFNTHLHVCNVMCNNYPLNLYYTFQNFKLEALFKVAALSGRETTLRLNVVD